MHSRKGENMQVIGRGYYTLRQAAKLAAVAPATLRNWYRQSIGSQLLSSTYGTESKEYLLSFLDLIESNVVARLRSQGLSLQKIRIIQSSIQEQTNSIHPFANSDLLFDGGRVWLKVAQEFNDDKQYIDLLDNGLGIPAVIEPFLKELVFCNDSKMALEWRIHQGVIINPEYNFGKPTVGTCKLSTSVLGREFAQVGSAEIVADWYGISPQDVIIAARYEGALAA